MQIVQINIIRMIETKYDAFISTQNAFHQLKNLIPNILLLKQMQNM